MFAQDKIDKSDKMDNPDMERPESLQEPLQSDDKDFSVDHLKEINDAMLTYPEDFHVLKKLNKVLEKRREPFESENGLVDWAQGATCICNDCSRWYICSINWTRQ